MMCWGRILGASNARTASPAQAAKEWLGRLGTDSDEASAGICGLSITFSAPSLSTRLQFEEVLDLPEQPMYLRHLRGSISAFGSQVAVVGGAHLD